MTITLHWPQITLLVLWALGISRAIRDHGTIPTSRENAWTSVVAMLITTVLLYFGGFWS